MSFSVKLFVPINLNSSSNKLIVQYDFYYSVEGNIFQLPNVYHFKTINEYLKKKYWHFIKQIIGKNEKKQIDQKQFTYLMDIDLC